MRGAKAAWRDAYLAYPTYHSTRRSKTDNRSALAPAYAELELGINSPTPPAAGQEIPINALEPHALAEGWVFGTSTGREKWL